MGLFDKLRKFFTREVDSSGRQAEGQRPGEAARRVPASRPARPAPPVPPRAARPVPPPARPPRHRLYDDRRPRRDDYDDVADAGADAMEIASATPQWIDVPTERHDHRHHGHSVEHGVGDSTPVQPHTTHHHETGEGWGSSHDHGSSGGYDGGGASCGSGGGD